MFRSPETGPSSTEQANNMLIQAGPPPSAFLVSLKTRASVIPLQLHFTVERNRVTRACVGPFVTLGNQTEARRTHGE